MNQSTLHRRLVDVTERLEKVRAELAVTDEQLAFLEDEDDEARLRSLVSETPFANVEAGDARRLSDALPRQREALLRTVAELVREQDRLLDRMSAELSAQ